MRPIERMICVKILVLHFGRGSGIVEFLVCFNAKPIATVATLMPISTHLVEVTGEATVNNAGCSVPQSHVNASQTKIIFSVKSARQANTGRAISFFAQDTDQSFTMSIASNVPYARGNRVSNESCVIR